MARKLDVPIAGREAPGPPEFCWDGFKGFVKGELAVGGPDPHMKIAVWLAQDMPLLQRVWFMGLYVGPYNISTAEVLFDRWPTHDKLLEAVSWRPEAVVDWLDEHWGKLVLRKERRPVNSPKKFAEYLIGYAQWIDSRFPALKKTKEWQEAWGIVQEVRYVGRYIGSKLYEALRLSCNQPRWDYVDIIPAGGWSPRLMLSWLYPEEASIINGGDDPKTCEWVNGVAEHAKNRLKEEGFDLPWFTFEVMLCDSKQALDGKQYPGRAHDSELGHYYKMKEWWPEVPFRMLEARKVLFPASSLGEVRGWRGRREELGEVFLKHKYVWNDAKHDYFATLASGDFRRPVPIGDAPPAKFSGKGRPASVLGGFLK